MVRTVEKTVITPTFDFTVPNNLTSNNLINTKVGAKIHSSFNNCLNAFFEKTFWFENWKNVFLTTEHINSINRILLIFYKLFNRSKQWISNHYRRNELPDSNC